MGAKFILFFPLWLHVFPILPGLHGNNHKPFCLDEGGDVKQPIQFVWPKYARLMLGSTLVYFEQPDEFLPYSL
jgi:hypothetical protein